MIEDLILILAIAMIGGFIAQKLKFPLVVGYLVAGVITSWGMAEWVWMKEVESVAALGVALLMFTLGLEFSLQRLRGLGEIIIIGSLVQILLTIVCGLVIFPLFGFDFYNSLFLGSVFSLSSTAVVVKILSDRGSIDTLHGEIAVGWLLIQDLATLPLIILLPSIGKALISGSGFMWGFLSLARSFSVSVAALLLLFLAGRKIIPLFIEKIAQTKSRELLLLSVISICLFFAFLVSSAGFSFALGAFLAGMLIASSASNHAVFSEVRPLRDIFSIIFFVSLGFLLDPSYLWEHFFFILVLTILLMGGKFLLSSILVILMGYHTRVAFFVGIMLSSGGEFAFILAQLGRSEQLITTDTYMMILSVTMLSLAISSPLIVNMEPLYHFIRNTLKTNFIFLVPFFKRFDEQKLDTPFEIRGHTVVLGHGRVGKYISKALYASGIEYVVIDYNNHIIKNLRLAGIRVIYGDPSEIDVLKVANIKDAKVVVIAIPDRHAQELVISNCYALNSQITIMCRTHHEEDKARLIKLGVELIIQPEFEAAVSITNRLLRLYDVSTIEIDEKIQRLKKEHGF